MAEPMTKDEFTTAFQKLYKSIYKTVFYIIRDKDLAYDIVQDAFANGYKNIHTLSCKDKFKPWIIKIATNLAYSYVKGRQEFDIGTIENIFLLEQQIYGETKDDVSRKIEQHELKNEIEKTILSLDKKYSIVLIYRFYCEMTYEEIAKAMNIDINLVKSRLYRAKQQMKIRLQRNRLVREYIGCVKTDEK